MYEYTCETKGIGYRYARFTCEAKGIEYRYVRVHM